MSEATQDDPQPREAAAETLAAVRALKKVVQAGLDGAWLADTISWDLRAALDRGEIPGYGPTGGGSPR